MKTPLFPQVAGWNGQSVLMSEGNDSGKKTVRANRRRKSSSGDRERAEAPRRRKSSSSSVGGTSSGSGSAKPPSYGGGSGGSIRPPTFSGGGVPGGCSPRMMLILLVVVVIIAICAIPIMLFTSGDDGQQSGSFDLPEAPAQASDFVQESEVVQESAQNSVTSLDDFTLPESSEEGQTWLVMLYQDADDKILEQDIYLDLNEAERIGSNDRVHIVSQVDRYNAGYAGDGNWKGTKRFYLQQDDDLQHLNSTLVADIGEANMSAGETLVDFVQWSVENFPADKHVLIMSDHGMGWPGGWSDPAPGGRADNNTPLAQALGDELYLMELDAALEEIRATTNIEQFELIGMDACLMGHLEVFTALEPHARYAVASQEVEPALGWAYTGFLNGLTRNPDMDGAQLGQLIVDSYIRDDQRIVDDEARAEFLRQGSPMGGLFSALNSMSAQQLAAQMSDNITLTAVDLQTIPALNQSLNDLAYTLQNSSQRDVAQARQYAQSFTSVFGKDIPPSYIDLGNFAQLIKREIGDADVQRAVDDLLAAIDNSVVAERHGPKKPGSSGVSIYFPNSQLYRSPVTGPQSYTVIAERFANDSLWDDYLAFHYTGRPYQASQSNVVVPEQDTAVTAPGSGAGEIEVSAVTLSDNVTSPGNPIVLSADISGDNVGYVYLFVGFLDEASNSIFVADSDYLESEESREINGVYYPNWGDEGEFTMEFEWEPIVFAINDGTDSVVAHFTPETYGQSFEDATYTVEGIYTYGDSGETRYARLLFSDGLLRQVFGFTNDNGTGAPREITPTSGDTFTVLEEWLDLDANGKVTQKVRQEGGTLTFGDSMFTWQDLDAAAGEYVVGFVVEDLDGNSYESFTTVTVE